MAPDVHRRQIEAELRSQFPALEAGSIGALAELQQDLERIDVALAPLRDSPWAVVLHGMPATGIAQTILHMVSEDRDDPWALRRHLAVELLRVWDQVVGDIEDAADRIPLGPYLKEVLSAGLENLAHSRHAAATPQLLVAVEGLVRQLAERAPAQPLSSRKSFEGVVKGISALWLPKRLIWSKWMFEDKGNPFRHGIEPADEDETFIQAQLLGFGVLLALDELHGQDNLRQQVARAIAHA